MKTTQTAGKQSSDKAGKSIGGGNTIDFRKDTPPTDWLGKRVKERYGHLPPADIKLPVDYHQEFISELTELRCKPDCTNGYAGVSGDTIACANGYLKGGQLASSQLSHGRLVANCICSLLREMTCEEAPLVPKGEFVAVVGAAGYSQKDALECYRNYAWTKLHDEHKQEFRRLVKERENAHNWWSELRSDEARAQASAAGNELRALEHQINENLEAVMSA